MTTTMRSPISYNSPVGDILGRPSRHSRKREQKMSFGPAAPRPPVELRTPRFVARPLRAADAAIDHAAFIVSPDTIRRHSGGRWPTEGFTVADNLPLAMQHEQNHEARRSFAYLLLDPGADMSLGCVYLLPMTPFLERVSAPAELRQQFDAQAAIITFWVRQDLEATAFPLAVVSDIREWIARDWRFSSALFRVNPSETSSLAALRTAGCTCRFSVEIATPPRRYSFWS